MGLHVYFEFGLFYSSCSISDGSKIIIVVYFVSLQLRFFQFVATLSVKKDGMVPIVLHSGTQVTNLKCRLKSVLQNCTVCFG